MSTDTHYPKLQLRDYACALFVAAGMTAFGVIGNYINGNPVFRDLDLLPAQPQIEARIGLPVFKMPLGAR